MPAHYFDDPEEGPAKATSHPAFVRLCKGALFYDVGDEFAPFGSDAGADTLHDLEDWIRAKRGPVKKFIASLVREWDFPIPKLDEVRPNFVAKWLADDQRAMYLPDIDQLLIASALGQLKITGVVEPAVIKLALAASTREIQATAHYKASNKQWKHAKAKAKADAAIRAVLEKL